MSLTPTRPFGYWIKGVASLIYHGYILVSDRSTEAPNPANNQAVFYEATPQYPKNQEPNLFGGLTPHKKELKGAQIDNQQARDVDIPLSPRNATKPCSAYIRQFDAINSAITQQHIPYDYLAHGGTAGYNSNSYVRSLLAYSHLTLALSLQQIDPQLPSAAVGYEMVIPLKGFSAS